MRKKIFFIGALATSLFVTTPVFAETDKEILFRDVPWGVSFDETCKLLPEFDFYGNAMEGLHAATANDVLKGQIYGSYNSRDSYDGSICFCAMSFPDSGVDIAGYPLLSMYLFYTYSTENGLSLSDNNTILYGATYEFEEPQDLDSMYSDLVSKLSEVYGEPDDSYDLADPIMKGTYTCWNGADDTAVAIQSYDCDGQASVYISYAWFEGDELLKKADDAFSSSKDSAESEIYGNGSINGL